MDDQRDERAKRRAAWVGRVTTLEDQDDAMLVTHGTAGERIKILWQVTHDAWVSSGREFPSYRRSAIPGRVIRGGRD